MKRASLVGIAIALGAVSLCAQSGSVAPAEQNRQQPVNPLTSNNPPAGSLVRKQHARRVRVQSRQQFVFAGPRPSGCPVGLRALQGSGAGLVKVRGSFAPGPQVPTQHIHFVVADPHATGARVRVFGHSDREHLEQTRLSNFEMHELGRTVDVTLSAENDTEAAADLVLPGFTSVQSIELESITYQDGSIWNLGTGQSCQIAPDPLMLIADR